MTAQKFLVTLVILLLTVTTYSQQRRTYGNNRGNPGLIIHRTDANGGYGGYYLARRRRSSCRGRHCRSNETYNSYYYRDNRQWGFGKSLLFQGLGTAIDAGAQYLVQRQLLKKVTKEQRKDEELAFKRQKELLQIEIDSRRNQYQPQEPSGSIQEPLSWTRISVTNCLPNNIRLYWNGQPIYFDDGNNTLMSMHRVMIEVPQVPGGIVTALNPNGILIQKFELHQGLTSLVIK